MPYPLLGRPDNQNMLKNAYAKLGFVFDRQGNMIQSLAIALLPLVAISALDALGRLPSQFSTYIVPIAWIWGDS
jgi:hypothetical protein